MLRGIIERSRPQWGFLACFVVPLGLCVLLNAVLRPWWARDLGGRRRAWSSTKGSDNWYEFSPETQRDHPLLTGFLSWHDSDVAMIALGAVALLFLGRAVLRRAASRGSAS
ncbi:hypothetical protein [Arthrobacter sp. NPDC090010]|uniref:hypothetical protein n=1 Tax=Arthrobacter sp. NPDC090010 TaxID=3363942 RepID=UPI00380E75C3